VRTANEVTGSRTVFRRQSWADGPMGMHTSRHSDDKEFSLRVRHSELVELPRSLT